MSNKVENIEDGDSAWYGVNVIDELVSGLEVIRNGEYYVATEYGQKSVINTQPCLSADRANEIVENYLARI